MSSPSESIHIWYRCHACGARPIAGRRFTCKTCPSGPDNDLCEACHRLYERGEVAHPAEHSPAAALGLGEHRFEGSEGRPRQSYLRWLEPGHPAAADPPVPDRFVLRPEFRSGADSYFGSHAFAVSPEGDRTLVVTALHVMDELLKKKGIDATAANEGYTGRELPAVVTGVTLYDVYAARWILAEVGGAGPMLVLPEARTDEEEPFSHCDVAAFFADGGAGLAPGRLASRRPEVGEPVWLAARLEDGVAGRTAKAVVVESTARTLVYRFQDPDRPPPYSSGAPVLDRAGEVVGVNVGGGWLDGRKLGHANHVESLRRHLAEGLRLAAPG